MLVVPFGAMPTVRSAYAALPDVLVAAPSTASRPPPPLLATAKASAPAPIPTVSKSGKPRVAPSSAIVPLAGSPSGAGVQDASLAIRGVQGKGWTHEGWVQWHQKQIKDKVAQGQARIMEESLNARDN